MPPLPLEVVRFCLHPPSGGSDAEAAGEGFHAASSRRRGTLETGRVFDYSDKGDENRKLCSMYLSVMDRMGVSLDKFGDADTRLAGR